MQNYEKSLIRLDNELKLVAIHNQVEKISNTIKLLNDGQVIASPLPKLGFAPDELEELSEKLSFENTYKINQVNNLLNNFRSFISRKYGIWSLANLKVAREIIEQFEINSVLEVMAGNAYWSKAFKSLGINAIATDSLAWAKGSHTGSYPFIKTEELSAKEAIAKYSNVDLIICSWAPNFGNGDLSVLNSFRAQIKTNAHLLFVGEKGGATNTPSFWKKAEIVKSKKIKNVNHFFKSFDFIDEKIYEIK